MGRARFQPGNPSLAHDRARPPPRQSRDSEPFPLTEFEDSQIREWERLAKKDTTDRGFLLAGGRAFDACFRTGRYDKALRIADSMRNVAEKRLHENGETYEALRDLSVSLDNVGNNAKALGQFELAQTRFEESLKISRKILERVGETPEALRDISVSLDNVGNTAKALGQFELAKEIYEEGLAVSIPLSESLPNHAEYSGLAEHFENRLKALAEEK